MSVISINIKIYVGRVWRSHFPILRQKRGLYISILPNLKLRRILNPEDFKLVIVFPLEISKYGK